MFNTPGANANAVKELVIAGIDRSPPARWLPASSGPRPSRAMASRSANWWKRAKAPLPALKSRAKSWVSSAWAPSAILVANAAKGLGMEVYGYDPYLSVERGVGPFPRHASRRQYRGADLRRVRLHHRPCPADQRYHAKLIQQGVPSPPMKDGVRILNFCAWTTWSTTPI